MARTVTECVAEMRFPGLFASPKVYSSRSLGRPFCLKNNVPVSHQVRRHSQSPCQDLRRKAFWELLRVLQIEGPPVADLVMEFNGKEAVDTLQAMSA